MFILLPEPVVIDGEKKKANGVHVVINHTQEPVITACGNVSMHQTRILIKTEKGIISKAEAKCSEFDVFKKSEGRKIALDRALKLDTTKILSKSNRAAIWQVICPKLTRKEKKAKK